ncbi:putative argonaute-like protein [Botrytis fragariae]|uniref:Putative argonaute-like protein n=1 Tax=Botrytis fragariae TaxID=1964551 RepID=A0A8H6AJB1_9HELO|nr:putative argonaute-like protein [Botrytis fragariae]KAF5868778.1 putative argonaute-like protein [Botrytis fragariae]
MCDNCFEITEPPHESKNCTKTVGKSCKSCGHAVCPRNKCLELGGKKISEIGQDIADRFTPNARDAWLRKYGPQSNAASSAMSQASDNTAGPLNPLPEPVADNRTMEEKLQSLYDEESRRIPKTESQTWDPSTKINANFYKVGLNSEAQILKYSVCLGRIISRGKPEGFIPTRPETKRYLIMRLLEENKDLFKSISWATDYDSFIVSNEPLVKHDLNEIGYSISTLHTRSGPDGKPINMDSSLTFLGLVNVKALIDHVNSKNIPLDHPEEELKFLNMISWKKVNSPQYEGGRVGKKFFPRSFVVDDEEWMSKQRFKQRKTVLRFKDNDTAPLYRINRGFFSSMRPGQGSVLLNVNVTTSAFFSPINLAKWIESNPNAWGDPGRLLKGVRVAFDIHEKNRQKVFNIKSIAPHSVSKTKFMKDGTEMSSKVTIKEAGLAELGFFEKDSFYKAFGIIPNTNLVEIIAGTLKAPPLLLGGTDEVPARDGSWEMKFKKCRKAGIENTTLHVLRLRYDHSQEYKQKDMKGVTDTLVRSLDEFGLKKIMNRVFYEALVPDEAQEPEKYRQACADTFKSALRPVIEGTKIVPLIMVVIPNRSRKLYPEIKRWADCDIDIPTVCAVEENLSGAGDRARCGNISLKFNLKLGGINQEVSNGCGTKSRTMVVGADVTHPGDEEGCPSIAAIVATDDDSRFQYLGSARLQEGKQEYISDLRGMMKERLLAWAKRVLKDIQPGYGGIYPQILPDQILFYRDGVSESQFGMVRHHEKQQIFDGCSDAYMELKSNLKETLRGAFPKVAKREKWKPKLTIIVAIKRHHARFYPLTLVDGDPNLNAGTIIDSVVVTPNHFSFYLQSHCSPLGTAKSNQYVVIYDDLDYKTTPKDIMNITNKLCYTGARAFKALSVCTPARYADMLCDRVRCYLKPVLQGYHDKDITDDMDGTKRAAVYEENKLVWKPNTSEKLPDGWKNPWHPSISNFMFYL